MATRLSWPLAYHARYIYSSLSFLVFLVFLVFPFVYLLVLLFFVLLVFVFVMFFASSLLFSLLFFSLSSSLSSSLYSPLSPSLSSPSSRSSSFLLLFPFSSLFFFPLLPSGTALAQVFKFPFTMIRNPLFDRKYNSIFAKARFRVISHYMECVA